MGDKEGGGCLVLPLARALSLRTPCPPPTTFINRASSCSHPSHRLSLSSSRAPLHLTFVQGVRTRLSLCNDNTSDCCSSPGIFCLQCSPLSQHHCALSCLDDTNRQIFNFKICFRPTTPHHVRYMMGNMNYKYPTRPYILSILQSKMKKFGKER